jgi:predicted DNA binding CopG/RHH family protein
MKRRVTMSKTKAKLATGSLPVPGDNARLAAGLGMPVDEFARGSFETVVLDDNEATRVQAMVEQAEADMEAKMVSLRMPKGMIDILKEAAALRGMKYQTYLKDVAFRQACTDLRAAASARG